LREAADFNAACAQNSGDLLPYIGTEYVARDIDLLRRALGEDQLTFYGRSFGTYIGTVYASLFPKRVRAMVLDGGYDPARYANRPYAYDRTQYVALDRAMARFLDWCGLTPAMCTFGDGDPKAAFQRLMSRLDAEPVPIPDRGVANGFTLAYRLLFNLNEGKARWPAIGAALRQAEARDSSSFLLSPPSPASFDFLTPNVAVECADRAYPRDLRRLERQLAGSAKRAPLLGPALAYGPPTYDHNHATACVQWRAERASRYQGSYRAAGSAPILVVGTTGDPDTPYRDSVALARTLDNATLLTFRAEGHTAFERSPCATKVITAYLTDGAIPPAKTTCADEPQPTPLT
jgi:pimeloyl-ACP methyl ester carboxylesterase